MAKDRSGEIPLIYNLFPPLVGDVDKWLPHVERAIDMGFNWVFLNPIHLVGASGSLYAIRDYFTLSPVFFPENDPSAQKARFKRFVSQCRESGAEVMVDLVINHTAYDNPLTRDHRDWYKLDKHGNIVNPGAPDDSAPDGYVTWGDLSEIDNANSPDRDNLWEYWRQVLEMFLDAGVRGYRCDAAYQVPNDLWRMLIGRARDRDPQVRFFAESLGCSLDETLGLVDAGHDFVFNSGKWWDYREDWFLDQANRMAGKTGSICFPESHDTERLATERNADLDHIKQHYLFTALISTGVLVPLGFEYGFKKNLHVVHTNPYDYEGANYDLTDFIRDVNKMKLRYRVFHQDSRLERIDAENHDVLALKKRSGDGDESALMVFNLVDHEQTIDLRRVLDRAGAPPLSAGPDGEEPHTLKLNRYGAAFLGM